MVKGRRFLIFVLGNLCFWAAGLRKKKVRGCSRKGVLYKYVISYIPPLYAFTINDSALITMSMFTHACSGEFVVWDCH